MVRDLWLMHGAWILGQDHVGTLHIGLDAWASPNGFSYLGVVVFRMLGTSKGAKIDRFVLDFFP